MPVSLLIGITEAMKNAGTLTVASLNLNGGDVIACNVPLEGVATATARVAELAK